MFASLLSKFWWMIMLRGVLAVIFGITLFAWPEISLVWFVRLFGLFAIADGCGNVAHALGARQEHESWWAVLLAGLAGIAVGALTFVNPAVTTLVVLFYLAIWAIVTGLLQVISAIRLRKEIEGEFWLMLGGLISVAFGMYLLGRPGDGALAILKVIATFAILCGVCVIALALAARGFVKRIKASVVA